MCCGNKRAEYVGRTSYVHYSPLPVTSVRIRDDIAFEYVGETRLNITGTNTGKKYRFAGPGDVQSIDFRDAGEMMAVPGLRRIG